MGVLIVVIVFVIVFMCWKRKKHQGAEIKHNKEVRMITIVMMSLTTILTTNKQFAPDDLQVKYTCKAEYGEEYKKCPIYKDRKY